MPGESEWFSGKPSILLTLGLTGNRPPLMRFDGRGVSGLLSVQLLVVSREMRRGICSVPLVTGRFDS